MLQLTYTCILRSMFCRQAIALAINIKSHFERVLNQQPDRSVVTQIRLPCAMPAIFTEGCGCFAADDQHGTGTSYQTCVDCGHKVRYIDYDDFLRTTRGGGKGNRRLTAAARDSSSTNNRKRVRSDTKRITDSKKAKGCDSDYDPYEPMRRMYEAVELQQVGRPIRVTRSALTSTASTSSNSMATSQIDSSAGCDYESDPGSALLLGMKRDCRVCSLSGETAEAAAARTEEVLQAGYESGSSSDGSGNSQYHAYAFLCSTELAHGDTEIAEDVVEQQPQYIADGSNAYMFSYQLPTLDACADLPLHIATSPFRCSDFATGAYLLTRCSSPDASLEFSCPVSATYMRAGGTTLSSAGASPGDGAGLRDFLAACYRDGMYPSPVVNTVGMSAIGESASRRSIASTCTGAQHSFNPGADTPWSMHGGPDNTHTDEHPLLDAVQGQLQVQGHHQDAAAPGPGQTLGNTTFAYEELQQLLSHLLHETASNRD